MEGRYYQTTVQLLLSSHTFSKTEFATRTPSSPAAPVTYGKTHQFSRSGGAFCYVISSNYSLRADVFLNTFRSVGILGISFNAIL